MLYRDILYSFTCLFFSIVAGAAVYEHIAVVPAWSAAPPASLTMFQGAYGMNPGPFWQSIHPVTLIFFIITLITFWKTARRKNVLLAVGGYVLVLVSTAIYFVPELLHITLTPYADSIDAALVKRAKMWELLSLIRLLFIVALIIVLMLGLTKNGRRNEVVA